MVHSTIESIAYPFIWQDRAIQTRVPPRF